MLRNLKVTLECLVLLALLIGCVTAEWWLTHRAGKIDSILDHLQSLSDTADKTAITGAPVALATLSDAQITVSTARAAVTSPINLAAAVTVRRNIVKATTNLKDAAIYGKEASKGLYQLQTENQQTFKTVLGNASDMIGSVYETSTSVGNAVDDLDARWIKNTDIQDSFKNFALVTASFNDLLLSSNHFMQSSDKVVQRFVPKPYTGKHRVLHGVGAAAWGTVNLGVPVGDLYRSVRGYPH